MIGPEDVDHQVVAAVELVGVICNIRQTIGGFAAAFNEYSVFFFAECGGFEPGSALIFVDQPFFTQPLQNTVDVAVFVEIALVEVAVHADFHPPEGVFDVVKNLLLGNLLERTHIRGIGQAVAPFVGQLAGDVDDILALVALIRQFRFPADELKVA